MVQRAHVGLDGNVEPLVQRGSVEPLAQHGSEARNDAHEAQLVQHGNAELLVHDGSVELLEHDGSVELLELHVHEALEADACDDDEVELLLADDNATLILSLD